MMTGREGQSTASEMSPRTATSIAYGERRVSDASGTGADKAPQHFSMQGFDEGAALPFEQHVCPAAEWDAVIEASTQWFDAASHAVARTIATTDLTAAFALHMRQR